MTLMRLVFIVLIALTASAPQSMAASLQQPEQQDEFIPISELPPQDVLPAAPLLIGAYVFVPVVLFLYLLSLAKRMTAVQREMNRLESELKRSA